MTNASRHTLGKAEKLKSRKQLEAVFTSGKSLNAFPLRLVYLMVPPGPAIAAGFSGQVKTGVSVSRKNFKNASQRNRGKRLLREAYRLHKHNLTMEVAASGWGLHLFFMITDKSMPDFALVENKMKYLLRSMFKKLTEVSTSQQGQHEQELL